MTIRNRTIEIETPEGVSFSLVLAGVPSRFLAWAVDACVIVGASQLVGKSLALVGAINADIAQALSLILYLALSIGYAIALEWLWRGQTLGKRLLRLRVMDRQGLHLRFNQVVIRNLMRAVDALPNLYLVGGLACLLSRDARRLGDFAADTIVVRHPKVPHPDLAQLLEGKFNSMLQHPHLAARLRQHASVDAAAIAIQALMRRDQLEPAMRIEVFREIADYFRSLVDFPEESVAQLTDEQVVRNAVEILAGRTNSSARPTPSGLAKVG